MEPILEQILSLLRSAMAAEGATETSILAQLKQLNATANSILLQEQSTAADIRSILNILKNQDTVGIDVIPGPPKTK